MYANAQTWHKYAFNSILEHASQEVDWKSIHSFQSVSVAVSTLNRIVSQTNDLHLFILLHTCLAICISWAIKQRILIECIMNESKVYLCLLISCLLSSLILSYRFFFLIFSFTNSTNIHLSLNKFNEIRNTLID